MLKKSARHDVFIKHIPATPRYMPFSVLNLSHASFNVANTDALIILISVLASWGNCIVHVSYVISVVSLTHSSPLKHARLDREGDIRENKTNLVRMHPSNSLHINNLNLRIDDQLMHANLFPTAALP